MNTIIYDPMNNLKTRIRKYILPGFLRMFLLFLNPVTAWRFFTNSCSLYCTPQIKALYNIKQQHQFVKEKFHIESIMEMKSNETATAKLPQLWNQLVIVANLSTLHKKVSGEIKQLQTTGKLRLEHLQSAYITISYMLSSADQESSTFKNDMPKTFYRVVERWPWPDSIFSISNILKIQIILYTDISLPNANSTWSW